MTDTGKQTLTFKMDEPKKYSDRYKEVVAEGDAAVIGTLYVQRWFSRSAKEITVDISVGGSDA